MPHFSIIIPTYNSENTLSKCLDSILNQSFTNYEVLIIDGVSTDSTLSIVKGYQDSRLKVTSEPDQGIYDAMNKGVKLAKGEWLYFLGSDDRFYSNDILTQVYNLILQTTSSILYGNVLVSKMGQESTIYDGNFSLEKLLNQNICHQAIFYKRIVFEKIGIYNVEYTIHADWDFNLRCWSKFQFYYFNEIVAVFTAGGYSQSGSEDSFSDNYWKILSENFLLRFYKYAFRQRIYSVFKRQWQSKRIDYALISLIQIIFFHPQVLMSKLKKKLCFQ